MKELKAAMEAIATAKTEVATALGEIEAGNRAQKVHAGESLRSALQRLQAAQVVLAELAKEE